MRTRTLPLAMQDTAEDGRQQSSRVRILVVDDNPLIVNHVTNMLQTDYQIMARLLMRIPFAWKWRNSDRIS